MAKHQTITVQTRRRPTTKLAEWQERQDDLSRYTQRNYPQYWTIGGTSGPIPCDFCLPQAPLYLASGSFVIDSDGTIFDVNELTGQLYVQADAAQVDTTTYQIPHDAQRVMDVWFDDLRATRAEHWNFTPENQIESTTTLEAGTKVTVQYVTQ